MARPSLSGHRMIADFESERSEPMDIVVPGIDLGKNAITREVMDRRHVGTIFAFMQTNRKTAGDHLREWRGKRRM